jgi:predicted PurR-regulated permease PerM
MTVEQFESISLNLGIGGLIAYMFYIMYRLAKDSGAGRIGSLAIFLSLGLGIMGFAAKSVIQLLVEV